MPTDQRMDKPNVVCVNDRASFSINKAGNLTHATTWRNPVDTLLTETALTGKDDIEGFRSVQHLEGSDSWRQSVGWELPGTGKGEGALGASGYRGSVLQDAESSGVWRHKR